MDMRGLGEDAEGGMCGESNMEIYITIYKIDSQWEFDVLGNSNLSSMTT